MAKLGRRKFLKVVGATATTVAAGPKFLLGSDAYGQATNNRVLVNIFGAGGFDGMTMFIDTANGQFMDEFNTRRVGSILAGPGGPGGLAVGSTSYRLHPRLPFIASEYNAGRVALLGSVGVATANSGSHDIATHDWVKGLSNGSLRGDTQPFTQVLAEQFLAGKEANIIRHAILERIGSRTYVGSSGLSVSNLSGFGFVSGLSGATSGLLIDTAFATLAQSTISSTQMEQMAVQESWSAAEQSVQSVATAISGTTISPAFPTTGIGNALKDIFIAIMNYEVRIAWASFGSNDRHSNLDPATTHIGTPTGQSEIWRNLNDALAAFYANLDRVGKAHLVATVVPTEFGRTSNINATNGSDHGKATNTFVMGGWINGGIYGAPPDVADLTSPQNRMQTKLPLGNVMADLLNGLKINGSNPISPTLFPWDHPTSIGIST